MPRSPRIVIPDVAHHVTQRGNRRQPIFFENEDYKTYRRWIADSCRAADVQVLAYCLMPNHVHIIMTPSSGDGLRKALAGAHLRYSASINRRFGWQGHLWQERFHSCALDDEHLLAAVRYVELNPLRAGLVTTPEDWSWSSSRHRIEGIDDPLVSPTLPEPLKAITSWRDYLAEGIADAMIARLRYHSNSGRPLMRGR